MSQKIEDLFGDEDCTVDCQITLNIRASGLDDAKEKAFKKLKDLMRGTSNNGFGVLRAEHQMREC